MNPTLRTLTHVTLLVAITLIFLRLASVIMIPLVFSILLSYLVHPLVRRMVRLHIGVKGKPFHLPAPLAIVLALLLVYTILSGFIYLFFSQLAVLIANLPQYQERITALFHPLQEAYKNFAEHLPGSGEAPEIPFGQALNALLAHLPAWFGGITELVINLILIFFLSLFMLMYSPALKEQIMLMVGKGLRSRLEEMFNRISEVMQQFLFGMALAQLTVALAVWFGLWAIGIQYAFLWGIFSGVLRVIPVVGLIVSAIPPLFMALIQFDRPGPFFVTLIFLVGLQVIYDYVFIPLTVGHKVDINPLTFLLMLMFWGWLWGIWGAILSLPLTALMRVVFDHSERLKPVGEMLGEPEKV
ncbi:MAG: AI-2E family transporter [Nitrospirae bacterium]|nr:AI-2E family transporter [Candidatus Manganitrophaceae bacterium]